jgi:MFS family permease
MLVGTVSTFPCPSCLYLPFEVLPDTFITLITSATGSAYLFTLCAFQLLFGKLFTLFSIKWVYLTAVVIFELGSVICGAAPTSVALIIGRAIAGIGAAGSFSGGMIIIAHSAPLDKRPMCTCPMACKKRV